MFFLKSYFKLILAKFKENISMRGEKIDYLSKVKIKKKYLLETCNLVYLNCELISFFFICWNNLIMNKNQRNFTYHYIKPKLIIFIF